MEHQMLAGSVSSPQRPGIRGTDEMYVDIFEEMMQMMQETSKAKRKLIHEKPEETRVGNPFLASNEQKTLAGTLGIRSCPKKEKRMHLHRMPGDPAEIAREKVVLNQQLRTGYLKAIILEFPDIVPFPRNRESAAGVVHS